MVNTDVSEREKKDFKQRLDIAFSELRDISHLIKKTDGLKPLFKKIKRSKNKHEKIIEKKLAKLLLNDPERRFLFLDALRKIFYIMTNQIQSNTHLCPKDLFTSFGQLAKNDLDFCMLLLGELQPEKNQ